MRNFDDVRNVLIPMGIGRPLKTKKYPFVAIASMLLSILYKYFTVKYINSVVLDFAVIGSIISTISFIYDKLYFKHCTIKFDSKNMGVVIGHSNTVLVLEGENVLKEYNCDTVIIRPANALRNIAFEKHSSVIECVQNNEITTQIIVNKIEEFENVVLFPNPNRADEDIKVIYED